MTDMERKHLAEADRHIAKCKAQVARQQKIIRQMTLRGQSTLWARDMLGAMETSLLERHRERVLAQAWSGGQGFPPASRRAGRERIARQRVGTSSRGLGGRSLRPTLPLWRRIGHRPRRTEGQDDGTLDRASRATAQEMEEHRARWEERRKHEAQIKRLRSRIGATNDLWIQAQIAKLKNQ